jgi:hypothetical protein
MAFQARAVGGAKAAVPIPEGTPDHDGEMPSVPFDFFASPPREIGKLISARSSLRMGRISLPQIAWVGISCLVGIAAFRLAYASGVRYQLEPEQCKRAGILFGALGAACMFLFSLRFRPTCSFVGENGVAVATMRGRRNNPPKIRTLVFNNAAELRAYQVNQRLFHYAINWCTRYKYVWNDFGGKMIFQLKGDYEADIGALPKSSSPFHLARMAEIAWSQILFDRANHCLKEEGSIPFQIDSKRLVRVGPGFIEFHFGGDPVRVTKDDIAKVTLGGGTFSFQHKDAKWFSRQGKFSFPYGQMANAKVFLFALDKLMGYRWE